MIDEIARLSARLIVMTETGADFLRNIYGIPGDKVDVIPHGIPDVPFVDPNFYKDQFGVEGRPGLLTFGLLSPNKGIENARPALWHPAGQIGEVVAAYAFGLTLYPSGTDTHDGETEDGRRVQVKLTGGIRAIGLSSEPDYLIVLQLRDYKFSVVARRANKD